MTWTHFAIWMAVMIATFAGGAVIFRPEPVLHFIARLFRP